MLIDFPVKIYPYQPGRYDYGYVSRFCTEQERQEILNASHTFVPGRCYLYYEWELVRLIRFHHADVNLNAPPASDYHIEYFFQWSTWDGRWSEDRIEPITPKYLANKLNYDRNTVMEKLISYFGGDDLKAMFKLGTVFL